MGWWPPPSAAERQPLGEGTVRDWGTTLAQLRRTFALERLYWFVWPERFRSSEIRSTETKEEG